MNNRLLKFLIAILIFFISCSSAKKKPDEIKNKSTNVIDSIHIENPVLLTFFERNKYGELTTANLVVEKDFFDSINIVNKYEKGTLKPNYFVYLENYQFDCLLIKLIKNETDSVLQTLYQSLQNRLRECKRDFNTENNINIKTELKETIIQTNLKASVFFKLSTNVKFLSSCQSREDILLENFKNDSTIIILTPYACSTQISKVL